MGQGDTKKKHLLGNGFPIIGSLHSSVSVSGVLWLIEGGGGGERRFPGFFPVPHPPSARFLLSPHSSSQNSDALQPFSNAHKTHTETLATQATVKPIQLKYLRLSPF